MTIRLNNNSRDAALDAIDSRVNVGGAGGIEIFEGNVNATFGLAPAGTSITTITFGAVAFNASSLGIMGSQTLVDNGDGSPSPSSGLVAGCFVITNGSGDIVLDGDISTTAANTGDLQLSDTTIGLGVVISIPTVTLTAGNAP